VDDAGGAFAMGLCGGAIYHSVGGARNAPRGHMLSQAIARVKVRTPILGGSFALWGMLFSCFDCSFSAIRKKEDPWNAIMSGAATGGLLAARAGLKAAGSNAAIGGVMLAAIEGLNIFVTRTVVPWWEKRVAEQQGLRIETDSLDPPMDPLRPYRPRINSTPLWQESSSSSSSSSPSSSSPSYFPSFGGLGGGGSGGVGEIVVGDGGGSGKSEGFDLDTMMKQSEDDAWKPAVVSNEETKKKTGWW